MSTLRGAPTAFETAKERFDSDGNLIDEWGNVMCDRCGENVATTECVECKVPFCADCAVEIHKKGKWTTHTVKKKDVVLRGKKRETVAVTKQDLADDADPEERRCWLQSKCMDEILETEATYINQLEFVQKHYIIPIRNGKFPELMSNTKGDLTYIFHTMELIITGNNELWGQLSQEILKEPNKRMFGQVFLSKLDNFQLYSAYCNHQQEAVDTVNRLAKSNSQFKQFLESVKGLPESEGFALADYLFKPFLRITKYPLLLKELIKHTSPEDPDYLNLQNALEKLQTAVDQINRSKAGAENMKKMCDLVEKLEGLKGFQLSSGDRRFVKEGVLMKISNNNEQERHFFLFNDILIWATKSLISNGYIVKQTVELNRLMIEDLQDTESLKNAIQLTREKNKRNKTVIIKCKSAKEKASWLRELELQKEDIDVKVLTNRPIWKPDQTTDNCYKCNAKFKVMVRRHHCRHCGHIFCQMCSKYSIQLPPEFGYLVPKRVCLDCFQLLSKANDRSVRGSIPPPVLAPAQVDTQNPLESYKEGFLVKKGHRRRNWNRRFFILNKGILDYYTEESAANDKDLVQKGSINLKDYVLELQDESNTNYKYCFLLNGKKAFMIRAESRKEFDEWVEVLSLVTKS